MSTRTAAHGWSAGAIPAPSARRFKTETEALAFTEWGFLCMESRRARRKALLTASSEGNVVGMFRRKPKVREEPERCPLCAERVPDGADECAMCGADLKALARGRIAASAGPSGASEALCAGEAQRHPGWQR